MTVNKNSEMKIEKGFCKQFINNIYSIIEECKKSIVDNKQKYFIKRLKLIKRIKNYTRYRNRIDRIIKCVSTDKLLDEQEQIRFRTFLNKARYHCQGKINKLKESKGEN